MSYALSDAFFTSKNIPNMDCKEQNFDLIGSIEAFNLDDVTTTFNRYLPKRTVRINEVGVQNGVAVPLYPKSAKISEASVQGRGGDGYEVSLTWQVQRPTEGDIAALEDMKRNATHLKITAFGDVVAYVLAEKEHYQMAYQQEGAIINCSLKVYNINGVQMLMN